MLRGDSHQNDMTCITKGEWSGGGRLGRRWLTSAEWLRWVTLAQSEGWLEKGREAGRSKCLLSSEEEDNVLALRGALNAEGGLRTQKKVEWKALIRTYLHSQRGSERGLKVKMQSCILCQRNWLFIIGGVSQTGFCGPWLMLLGPLRKSEKNGGTTLMDQWLKPCCPSAGGQGSILVKEIPHASIKSLHAATKIKDPDYPQLSSSIVTSNKC